MAKGFVKRGPLKMTKESPQTRVLLRVRYHVPHVYQYSPYERVEEKINKSAPCTSKVGLDLPVIGQVN